MNDMIYLDNAATTPLSPIVIEKVMDIMNEQYGNPSSIHRAGRTAKTVIEKARRIVANTIKASLGEVFFTSCGTESNNMILRGAIRDLGVQQIISTKLEHHCILHTLDAIVSEELAEVIYLNTDQLGRIDYNTLEELLKQSNKKTLVSLMHGNNEIGTLLDLEKVAQLCEEHQAFFHSDTVQSIGFHPIDVQTTKIHFLSGSAHKFHGPKGVGFVYINGEAKLNPFIYGGAQERNMRGGTENIYGIVGLATALAEANKQQIKRRKHIEGLRQYLKQQLDINFKDIEYNGDQEHYLYKLLSVSFPPSPKADLMVMSLDIAGICASGGSACSSGAEHESHVLATIHPDSPRKTVRFSFSYLNTSKEIDILIEKLKEILQ